MTAAVRLFWELRHKNYEDKQLGPRCMGKVRLFLWFNMGVELRGHEFFTLALPIGRSG